jgi:hypothetical protein
MFGPSPFEGLEAHDMSGPVGPHRSRADRGWDPAADPARNKTFSFSTEAMLLDRTASRNQVLVRAGAFDPNGEVLLSTNDLEFDHEFVPRFNFVLHQPSGFDFVFNYFDSERWKASEMVVSETEITVSAPNILIDNFNAARFTYSSQLSSSEYLVQCRVAPRLTVNAGVRWIEFSEVLFQEDNFPNLDVFVPSYSILVENRMLGAQLGIQATLFYLGDYLSIDAQVKGGYYINEAEHRIDELAGQTLIGPIAAEVDDENATVMEVHVAATVRFNDHVKIWAGYNVMWMIGVATAPQQIPGNDVFGPGALVRLGPVGALSVDTADTVLLSGANCGLEVSY